MTRDEVLVLLSDGGAYAILMVNETFVAKFLIDTGAYFSHISIGALRDNGLEHFMEPARTPFIGKIGLKLHSLDSSPVSEEFMFHVTRDCDSNMLGLDFLVSSRSVLVLDPEHPRLWVK